MGYGNLVSKDKQKETLKKKKSPPPKPILSKKEKKETELEIKEKAWSVKYSPDKHENQALDPLHPKELQGAV